MIRSENGHRPVALVTGGSRGIGRAIVRELARAGHDVSFCYRACSEGAREVQREVRELGARVLAQTTDVADIAAVQALVESTERELGPIDVAVACAGITRDGPLVMMTEADWNDVLRVNLDGVYHVCRTVVFGMMRRKRGVILNISSTAGVYGSPAQSNYSASKAGIIGFTRALAKEVGRYGIRANVVAPGFIETDMTAVLNKRAQERATDSVPLRRFGQPDEVAGGRGVPGLQPRLLHHRRRRAGRRRGLWLTTTTPSSSARVSPARPPPGCSPAGGTGCS